MIQLTFVKNFKPKSTPFIITLITLYPLITLITLSFISGYGHLEIPESSFEYLQMILGGQGILLGWYN